jgi:hypothetical protein
MIKNLFLFFAVLGMFAALSRAQVSSVTGQYLQDNNLLINPGFESGIGKWTNSAGTFTADYSVFVQGKASGKVVLSSQNMDFYQDSTLFATQLADGMQAILTVKIKSSVAGVRVCPRQAGVVITSLCVSVQGNDEWGLYQIPFVTGATSQGISINSNSTSITGTVYIDESYVGVSNILNSSSEAKLAGEAYFAGTTGCNWTRTSTTVGAFGTVAACPGPTIVRQSLGAWQTTDSDLPRVTVNNLPAGTYKAKFLVRHVLATSGNSSFAINDGTTTCEPQYGKTGGIGAYIPIIIECTFNYTSAGNRVFELYAGSTANTITVSSDTSASPRISSKFILEYYGSNSTYTTTAGINNVDVFSAKVSAAGVVSAENVNWINGNASVAITSQYTITFNTSVFTIAPNCTVTGSDPATNTYPQLETISASSLALRMRTGATNTAAPFNIICQKQGADFVASKTITGSFLNTVTVHGENKQVICAADVLNSGTASFSSQKGNCFSSVSRSTLGRVAITIDSAKLSTAPICTLAVASGSGVNFCKLQGFPTSSIIDTTCYTTSANSDQPFSISCIGTAP